MDANKHTINGPLQNMLEAEGVELEEFLHKYWGNKPPNTHVNDNISIDSVYKTPDVKVTAFCMLGFMESPGDHRSWLIEVTTRSMLGKDLLKLSDHQEEDWQLYFKSLRKYNKIVEHHF